LKVSNDFVGEVAADRRHFEPIEVVERLGSPRRAVAIAASTLSGEEPTISVTRYT
jgi:hypothetical protein